MHFLKCNKCGHLNEVKSQYLIFCSKCNKKLDNNFSDWQRRNPEKSLEDFKQLICVSANEIQKSNEKAKPVKQMKLKYWIGFAVAFAIFYAIGHFAGEKIISIFKKPVFEKALVEYASEFNKNCPVMIDNATRLDNTLALPDNTFQYNYTILTVVKDSVDVDALKSYVEPTIINAIKTEPQMKIFRDNKTTINYNYKDVEGVTLFTISIKPEQYE
ncbi:MAG TPA: hypothetical protein VHO72_00445 [Bacteroidales bacterium]|nr:hypothetical protein [Bacteroidales bacterium]